MRKLNSEIWDNDFAVCSKYSQYNFLSAYYFGCCCCCFLAIIIVYVVQSAERSEMPFGSLSQHISVCEKMLFVGSVIIDCFGWLILSIAVCFFFIFLYFIASNINQKVNVLFLNQIGKRVYEYLGAIYSCWSIFALIHPQFPLNTSLLLGI